MISQRMIQTGFLHSQFMLPNYSPASGLSGSPQELGYVISEDELAGELQKQVPIEFSGQISAEIRPEEFEGVFGWFPSLRM